MIRIRFSCFVASAVTESKEGDGFLLCYKRLDIGAFDWPRSADEALEITPEQYCLLMQGFEVMAKRPITELVNPPKAM